MEWAPTILASPAAACGFAAAILWAPATGYPTWPAVARGRFASTVMISFGVGGFVFVLARRAFALGAG